MVFETENIMNENQNLTNEMNFKKDIVKKQAVQHGRQRDNKLERVRNMWNRKMMKGYFDKWGKNALKIQNLDEAVCKLKKTEHKRRLRIWYQKWIQQAKGVRRGANITDRC
jgi:hypothetical protein